MKNELLAKAMTYIDDMLIDEANVPAVGSRPKNKWQNSFIRWGSLAACLVLLVGVMVMTQVSKNDVLLYGEKITDTPRTISEYMPKTVAYTMKLREVSAIRLPLELDFSRETVLKAEEGKFVMLSDDGKKIDQGNEYVAKGAVSLCLELKAGTKYCTVTTDRGYDIILKLDEQSNLWYINIENKK